MNKFFSLNFSKNFSVQIESLFDNIIVSLFTKKISLYVRELEELSKIKIKVKDKIN